tara:strand:- start:8605 stop:8826 length:222 start_codon:yes stop_codon:yes gene_type:complete
MLLSLDNVAQRYGVLPSVALKTGDTLDLLVLHTAAKWSEWQNSDEFSKNKGHTTESLQKMVDITDGINKKRQH